MKKTLALICLLLTLSNAGFAAITATTIWQLTQGATANNVNGGGFDPGNANFLTDLACTVANTNSPSCTSASYTFVAGDANAWLYVKAGTNYTVGWYQIASVSAGAAILSAAVGAAVQVDTAAGYPTPRYKASTVAGVATVASPTGGTFGIDFSQGTAAIATNTDLASADATAVPCVISSAGSAFSNRYIGNIVHITAGTNFTAGWYEIVSVSGANATLDRACGTGVGSSGTFYVGGAMSLASTLDDDFFEAAASATGGNRIFVKNTGTAYTLGEAVSVSAAGGATSPVVIEGYNSLRGDSPTGANRPTLNAAAVNITLANNWDTYNLIVTATQVAGLSVSGSAKVVNVKAVNSSTTANRAAITLGANSLLLNSEAVSYRGVAVTAPAGANLVGNYIHDSDVCVSSSATTNGTAILDNLIIGCVAANIKYTAAAATSQLIANNTIYGAENKANAAIGLSLATGATNIRFVNNIVYGLASGVTHADAQTVAYDDYNDYFNNTADVSAAANWQKGKNDLALDPTFASVAQITATGASVSGSVITKASCCSTVVAGRDFVYVISGTGVTAGYYGITSADANSVTTDIAPGGSGSDIAFQITTGRNFAVGNASVKGAGLPGAFPGGYTTGYNTPGAAQTQATGGQKAYAIIQ